MPSRRRFLSQTAAAAALAAVPFRPADDRPILKPPRLKPGDTVGVVSPASANFRSVNVDLTTEVLEALGLRWKLGEHVLDRRGYFAGEDEARAADLNRMFADPEVDAIITIQGGWGAARILPYLDYDQIRANPKILVGYSDVTALLLAIYAQSGLVTFHGPNGLSDWNAFTVDYFRRLLFDGEPVRMANKAEKGDNLVQREHRIRTLTPGTARGPLAGGNLTIISTLMGTPYLPDWDGHLFFFEDINEGIYRVDRMLTQLRLAGVLDDVAGVVIGVCNRCDPEEGYGGLTLEEVYQDHVGTLGVPAWYGAMFGHLSEKFTMPLGIQAEIDAEQGVIQLLEPAVR